MSSGLLGGRGECEFCYQWHNNVSYHREHECVANPQSSFYKRTMRKDEPPHFVQGEDCMGRPEEYWRQFLFCSDDKVVCGIASTAEEATLKAKTNRDTHEKFISLPARQRVKEILAKSTGYPSAQDQGELNRAFAELLGCL